MVHFQSCSLLRNRILTCGRLAVIILTLFVLTANSMADVDFSDNTFTGNGTYSDAVASDEDLTANPESGNTITLSGVISGAGSLTKTGDGTLALSNGGSSFTGNLIIDNGVVLATSSCNLNNKTSAMGKLQSGRSIIVNPNGELCFTNNDALTNGENLSLVPVVVNGGRVTNEGAVFNNLSNIVLKNGATLHAANGHANYKAFKLSGNVYINRNDNDSAASPVQITTSGAANAAIALYESTTKLNVADVTRAPGAAADDLPDLIISAPLVNAFLYSGSKTLVASMQKLGAGTVTLSGANTYTGTTTVSGGKLNITGSKFNSRLLVNGSATAVIDVGASGVVNMNADGFDNAVMIGHGASGSLTLESGSVTIRNSDPRGKKGSINLGTNGNGNGVLTINGGTMQVDGRILMGANSGAISGTLNMNGGTLTLGVSGSYTTSGDPACGVLWFGYNKSTVNLNGGTIAMFGVKSNGPNAESSFNFNGGTLKAVADNNVDFFPAAGDMKYYVKQGGATFDTQGFNVTVGAKLEQGTGENDGEGGLTKLGTGTLTLSGANTYTGVTTISAGTLKITGSTFNSRLIIDNGTAIIDVGSNGVVNINADGYYNSVMIANAQGASAALNGELILNSGTVTIRNSTATNKTASIQLGTNDDHKPSTPVHGTGTLTINGGSMQVDGRILMSANNVDAKGTLNMNGGLLSLGVPGSYTTSGDPACGVLWFGYGESSVNLNGGTISLFGIRYTIDSRYGNTHGTFNFNGGTLQAVANNNVDFFPAAGDMKYYVKQGGAIIDTQEFNVTVGAKLEKGTGENDDQGRLTKLGTGTLTLSQAPTYTGATKISAGTLKLSEGGNLYNLSGGSLDADGQISVAVTLDATGKALTLSNSDLTKFIGSITASTITKTGDETLQIYTGADGLVDAQSMVISSGRMDLKGYMTGGITIQPDSVFSPGNSVGDARFGGGYELKEDAKLLIEQDETGIDTLTATSFDINPNSILELTLGSVEPGRSYDIIFQTDSEGNPKDFTSVEHTGYTNDYSDAAFWNSLLTPESAYYWNLSVDGNIVRATIDANAVPEPSTWALLILGAAGLLYWRKRK